MKQNFIRCGVLGWCWEILFTGFCSIFTGEDHTLMGNTSLLMFPIYGAASFFTPLARKLRGKSVWLRGSCYTMCIYAGELASGLWLKKWHMCPWDYSGARLNLFGVIRLDFAPGWFVLGLLMERLLLGQDNA